MPLHRASFMDVAPLPADAFTLLLDPVHEALQLLPVGGHIHPEQLRPRDRTENCLNIFK